MKKTIGLMALAMMLAAGSSANAAPFTGTASTFGNATGTGPWNLTSEVSPFTYSGIKIDATSSTTFSELLGLTTAFTDVAGGAYGGSPRFSVGLDVGGVEKFVHIALGTPNNFNDSDPTAFTTAYSGFNVIGTGPTDNRYDVSQFGGSPFTNYATAVALIGSLTIEEIDLVLDGAWGANGRQEMNVRDISVNDIPIHSGTTPAATPEPITASLFGAGLIGLGALRRKKKAGV